MANEKGKLKENARGNVYSDKFMVFPPGRAYFVKLTRPDPKFNKYQVTVLYDKTNKAVQPALKALIAEYKRLVAFKYGDKVPSSLVVPPVKDGDTATDKEGNLLRLKYKEYAGRFFITIGNKDPIRVVSGAKETLKDIEPSLVMNGVIIDGTLQCLLYADGCSWQAKVVRLVKDDGVRYQIGPDSAALLGALEAEEQDESLESAVDSALGAEENPAEEEKPEPTPEPAATKKASKSGKAAALDVL